MELVIDVLVCIALCVIAWSGVGIVVFSAKKPKKNRAEWFFLACPILIIVTMFVSENTARKLGERVGRIISNIYNEES